MIIKTVLIFITIFSQGSFIVCTGFESNISVDIHRSQNQLRIQDSFETAENNYKSNDSIIKNVTDSAAGSVSESSTKGNQSSADAQSGNSTFYVSCVLNKTDSTHSVEIVNASKLASLLHAEPNVTSRQTPGSCVLVMFYSPSCPFSCMAAPHYNALPRIFPNIRMVAVDAIKYRIFNAQYGIVGTPTLMMFHSGRPAAKLNETSEYGLEVFSNFIVKHTGIQPVGKLVVTSADFNGPVSSIPVRETDYFLLLSWLVIAVRILYSFYFSTWGRSLVDATLNAWREAEAQHHHTE